VSGPAGSPTDLSFAGSPPQAATYAGSTLIIAAAAAGAGMPNLFVVDGINPVVNCTATDDAGMPLEVGALAADSTNLWVWGHDGSVLAYDLTMVKACTATLTATNVFTPTAPFVPGTGARLHIVSDGAGHELGILAGHADKATNGEVVVLDLTTATPTQKGTTLSADGVLSSTVATFDGAMYLVLGYPTKTVKNVQAGEVDILDLDPATGTLGDMPTETLSDAQPDNGEVYGRDVTTMQFNGHTVLVIAASNEVFSYYRTSLYPTDTRNPAP
jgi:hypothetical protein